MEDPFVRGNADSFVAGGRQVTSFSLREHRGGGLRGSLVGRAAKVSAPARHQERSLLEAASLCWFVADPLPVKVRRGARGSGLPFRAPSSWCESLTHGPETPAPRRLRPRRRIGGQNSIAAAAAPSLGFCDGPTPQQLWSSADLSDPGITGIDQARTPLIATVPASRAVSSTWPARACLTSVSGVMPEA